MNVLIPTPAPVAVTAPEVCGTCDHPMTMHDVLSTRWCAATQLGVGHRGCICSGVVGAARSTAHY